MRPASLGAVSAGTARLATAIAAPADDRIDKASKGLAATSSAITTYMPDG
ncbi:hypothetical protein [Duganella sp. LjRoot269]